MKIKMLKRFLGKKKKSVMLFLHYVQYFSAKQPKTKQIVVCFDGVVPHGGLVDRLKGIISFYQIAKELNYDFKILFDNPFKLSSFLEPNNIDWNFSRKQIHWHPTKTKIIYLINNFGANPMQLIQNSSAIRFYVYANIDYSKSTFPELNQLQLEHNWRESFNALFKQSSHLSEKLNQIETKPFIAFHSRFTSLMGDFKDTTTKILPYREREVLCDKLLQLINKTILTEAQKAYLFSDSINFIAYVKDKINIKTVEGNPFHMDNFEKTKDTNGHLKTLIDFFMISKSEKVYFLKVNPMYNSSFSKYAAIVGNTKFERLEA
jgi:hypothetical protein